MSSRLSCADADCLWDRGSGGKDKRDPGDPQTAGPDRHHELFRHDRRNRDPDRDHGQDHGEKRSFLPAAEEEPEGSLRGRGTVL